MAVSLWVLLLALFLTGYFFAMRPAPGSLQWIARFDPPKFSFDRHPLRELDGFWMAVVSALGAVVSYLVSGTMSIDFSDFVAAFFLITQYILLPMVTCAATFWTIKTMTGQLGTAFWSSTLVALDVFMPAAPMAMLSITAALLYHYASQADHKSLAACFSPLALVGGVLALGIYFHGGLVFLLFPIFAILFFINYCDFLETGHFWRNASLHLGCVAIGLVLTLLGIFTPVALIHGQPVLNTWLYPDFYQLMATQLAATMTQAFGGLPLFYAVFTAYTHWPILLAGLFTLPPLCHGIWRLRSGNALLALVFGIIVGALWLFLGISALFYGAALGLAFCWSQLQRQGYRFFLRTWYFAIFLGILAIYMMIFQ